MPGAPMRVFASHSSKDREFALRLGAGLEARNIQVWLDLRNLEGGEEFDKKIESVIQNCACLLVILSPEAVDSRWVRSEIQFAFDHTKPIIPVMRRKTYPPVPINTLHYIECLDDDEQTLDHTLQAIQVRLYKLASDSATLMDVLTSLVDKHQITRSAPDEPIPAAPSLPLPDPNLNALYLAGLEAAHAGDLERANALWQEILDQQPAFRSGQVAEDMSELRPRLLKNRMRNAQATAEKAMEERRWQQAASSWNELLKYIPNSVQAHEGMLLAIHDYALEAQEAGAWDAALGAWQTLLHHKPQDALAQEYFPIVEVNRSYAHLYDDAVLFVQQGKPELARLQLTKLWQKSPYYGDPQGIAPGLGVQAPPTLHQLKVEAARKAIAERLEQEAAARAQAERDRVAREQAERERIAREQAENRQRVAKQAQLERKQAEKAIAVENRDAAIAERDEIREEIYTLKAREEDLKDKTRDSGVEVIGGGCGCATITAGVVGIGAVIVNMVDHHNIFPVSAILAGVAAAIVFVWAVLVFAGEKRSYQNDLRGIPDKMKPLVEHKSELDEEIVDFDEAIGDERDPAEETFEAWQARKKSDQKELIL